jgi:hypothetical protein
MKRLIPLFLVFACALAPARAQSPAQTPAVAQAVTPEPAPSGRFAIGLSADFQDRADFGEGTHLTFVPGIVGFLYIPTPVDRLYLRPGARLSFTGLEQTEMPAGVRLNEWDVTLGGEIGVLFDSPVVPAISVGVEGITRVIRTTTDDLVMSETDQAIEFLPGLYGQVALGVPIMKGRVMVEPFWRYEHVFDDPRIQWRVGIDATFLLF